MTRKPSNFQWLGFTRDELVDLDFLDLIGTHGWAPGPLTLDVMPALVLDLDRTVGLTRAKQCMADIGYTEENLQMLDRWFVRATKGASER